MPRSTGSRPTSEFVTGTYTHTIQDLRAFARKDMDVLVSEPATADRALQLAFSHKDVHLADRLLDAGATPCRLPKRAKNAFETAISAFGQTTGEMQQQLEDLVDRMLGLGPQWMHCRAASELDMTSPERWRNSLIKEIKSHPLSDFHDNILLHCLEIPGAIKALLAKGAIWRSDGIDQSLRIALETSQHPLEVLASLKLVDLSTRPHHAPGSDRLARRRAFNWEEVLSINPMEKKEWFNAFHSPVMGWTRANLKIDLARLMLDQCAKSRASLVPWPHDDAEAEKTLAVISGLVGDIDPAARRQSGVAETVATIALGVKAEPEYPALARFSSALENLVIRMVDEMGFAAPDLSRLPNPPDHGRLHSFCTSRLMQQKTRQVSQPSVNVTETLARPRF